MAIPEQDEWPRSRERFPGLRREPASSSLPRRGAPRRPAQNRCAAIVGAPASKCMRVRELALGRSCICPEKDAVGPPESAVAGFRTDDRSQLPSSAKGTRLLSDDRACRHCRAKLRFLRKGDSVGTASGGCRRLSFVSSAATLVPSLPPSPRPFGAPSRPQHIAGVTAAHRSLPSVS